MTSTHMLVIMTDDGEDEEEGGSAEGGGDMMVARIAPESKALAGLAVGRYLVRVLTLGAAIGGEEESMKVENTGVVNS